MPENLNNDGGAGDQKPVGGNVPTNPSAGAGSTEIDVTKLSGDQLAKVLENPELWKQPRIAELLESQKSFKKLQEDKAKAEEETLAKNKEFQTLAEQRQEKLTLAEQQIRTLREDQALTQALIKESVIDLDGALKLIDRSKLQVDENGVITGIEMALNSLKTDKAYLFGAGSKPTLGNPSNGQQPAGGAPMKFKRSQLQDQNFYAQNREEILKASKAGLIEDDISPQR